MMTSVVGYHGVRASKKRTTKSTVLLRMASNLVSPVLLGKSTMVMTHTPVIEHSDKSHDANEYVLYIITRLRHFDLTIEFQENSSSTIPSYTYIYNSEPTVSNRTSEDDG